jgi:hypothetical protein
LEERALWKGALENLIDTQIIKKFHTFYELKTFIAILINATPSYGPKIEERNPFPNSLWLSFSLFPSVFPTEI